MSDDIERYRNLLKGVSARVQESRRTCTACGATNKVLTRKGICHDCHKAEDFNKRRRVANVSKAGYTYVYDDEGNYVLKHRMIMEKVLGRKLRPHEAVSFRDNDRTNFDPENLVLSLKAGFRLADLHCPHCGNDYC